MDPTPWRALLAWALVLVVGAGATRAVVALPERCDTPTPARLARAAGEAVAWFERNQRVDGTWLYRVDVDTGTDLGGYNWVRHAGVMLSLEQAAARGSAPARRIADDARAPVLGRLAATPAGGLAMVDGGWLTTGGTALLAVALGERRLATGDGRDDARLRAMGTHLRTSIGPDGTVANLADPATGAMVPGSASPFATGQVVFALARLERLFPGEGWGDDIGRVVDDVIHHRAERDGYVPDVSDHWSAYGLAERTTWAGPGARLSHSELGWARRQMGIMGIQVRYESQRTNGGIDRWLRGRTALGAGVGTIGEALGAWARVAAVEPALAPQQGWVRERLGCVADVLARRQVSPARARALPDPSAAQGAFVQFGITQMDDQQHTLSALLLAADVIEGAEPPGMPGRRAPVPDATGLAALAAAAALNPWRLRRRGPRGPARPAATATGVAAGAAAVGLAALAGGPLLEQLQVSAATAVVAAGLAVALSGLVTLARAGAGPLPALAGRRAGLVPVAVPLVARPELLLLAAACGRGGRGLEVVVGVVLAGLVAVAMAARPDRAGPGALLAGWALRLLATGAVLAGVALVVEGVFSV